ncbi:MAG: 6-bladed beta-propeller, partial [Odoribacteraceae bacterium]|nr:6-bladed beta-propeller [Odoribacteraceae bacterium]
MNKLLLFFSVMSFLFFSACRKNSKRAEAEKIVTEWTGKTIHYPEGVRCSIMGKDTVLDFCSALFQREHKILLYVDSTGCSGCRLQFSQWKQLIEESDSLLQSKARLCSIYDEEKTVIDVEIRSGTINIHEVLDSVKYVCLETSDDCLIREINKIVYHDNKYYILDRTKTKRLLCFDSAGRFERSFGRTGQGPGEYVEPTDFMITSSQVIILDQFAHKLLFFDKRGNFIYPLSLKYKIHAITSLDNDSLFIAKAGDNRHTDLEDHELLV